MFIGNFPTPYGVSSNCHCVTSYTWGPGPNLNVTVGHYYAEQNEINGDSPLLTSSYTFDLTEYLNDFPIPGMVSIDAIEDVLQTMPPYNTMVRQDG
jgi:hypothetical protein